MENGGGTGRQMGFGVQRGSPGDMLFTVWTS